MESIVNSRPSLSILLAEDEMDALELLTSVLSCKYPAFTFFSAVNGSSALELFSEYMPGIVITDINMPGMNGIKMIDEMRKVNAGTKYIVITAHSQNTLSEDGHGNKLKIEHFLKKPLDFGKLFAAIEQCLSEIEQQK